MQLVWVFSTLTFNLHSFLSLGLAFSCFRVFLVLSCGSDWLRGRMAGRKTWGEAGRSSRRRWRMTQSWATDRCVELTAALRWWAEMRKWRDQGREWTCQTRGGRNVPTEQEGRRRRNVWGEWPHFWSWRVF